MPVRDRRSQTGHLLIADDDGNHVLHRTLTAMLYAAHKTRWKAAHPVCRLLMQRAATALAVYDAENRRLGELQGRRRALLADRSTYVFHAVGIFLHKADLAKRQGSGMARKQGADGRPSILLDSPLKRAFDRVAEYFNN